LAGALTFLTGSTMCVLAGSFEQLVAFRLLQGVGAGSITRRGARRRAGPVRTLRRRLSLAVGNLNLVASALRQLGIVARR
jgi:MFS family permease